MTNELLSMISLSLIAMSGMSSANGSSIKSGLGETFIIVGIFMIIWLFLYIIGNISSYKKTKKLIKPNSKYFSNVFGSFTWVRRAMSGILLPKVLIVRSDAMYYRPTREEFLESLREAHKIMLENGWSPEEYLRRAKDCEDFAMKMCVEAKNYIATNYIDRVGEKGVAIGFVSYMRDDGIGHTIVQVMLSDGKHEFYEPYPREKNLLPMKLTKTEFSTIYNSVL